MKIAARVPAAVLVSAFAFLRVIPAFEAQTFMAEGRMLLWNPARSEVKRTEFGFTAYVADGQWLIRMQNQTTNVIAFQEMAFDGTNRTSVSIHSRVSANSINVGTGAIHAKPMTEMDSSFVAPVWLALDGTRHFKSLTNNIISPMWINPPTRRVARYEPTAEWEFSKQSSSLLESVRFYETAGWLPAPYDEGFLRAAFQVTDWTNVGGLILPARWELQDYHPQTRAVGGKSVVEADNRDDTRPEGVFQVELTRVEMGTRLPRYQARPTGPVIMQDKRVTPPRTFLATPETFPLEDPAKRNRFPPR